MGLSNREGLSLSGLEVLRIVIRFGVLGLSLEMVISGRLSQVGRDRRAETLDLWVLSSAMLGRDMIGETIDF